MLNAEVREAVESKAFHVYAVDDVDQALTLITGSEAGKLNPRGRFPKHSVHERAVNRLYAISCTVNGAPDEQ